jgi:hypothetical protein
MKKFNLSVFLCIFAAIHAAYGISLDDIQLWTGSGTNRAALVIEWSVPLSLANSTVSAPVADKTLVWGYRFNGLATATAMLDAVIATDPRLYVVENNTNRTTVEGIGYNLNANGNIGITDGTNIYYITNGILATATWMLRRRSIAETCIGAG